MMKTIGRMMAALMLALITLTAVQAGSAEAAERPRMILYTFYRQVGWGDAVQIGCVDEKGGLWTAEGHDADLKWPYRTEEQLAWLASSPALRQAERLDREELFNLRSLVSASPDQGEKAVPAANDAGTERSVAVYWNGKGEHTCVLLGMSGDDMFENTDPNAQALYLRLRQLFPKVTCYAGHEGMGPRGFEPKTVKAFCGWEDVNLAGATVTAFHTDCEAGPSEISVSPEKAEQMISLVRNGLITGKANASMVTGGTTVYCFTGRDGKFLLSVEIYGGMLCLSDGMYYVSD